MISKISQTERQYHIISLVCGIVKIKKKNLKTELRTDSGCKRQGVGNWQNRWREQKYTNFVISHGKAMHNIMTVLSISLYIGNVQDFILYRRIIFHFVCVYI